MLSCNSWKCWARVIPFSFCTEPCNYVASPRRKAQEIGDEMSGRPAVTFCTEEDDPGLQLWQMTSQWIQSFGWAVGAVGSLGGGKEERRVFRLGRACKQVSEPGTRKDLLGIWLPRSKSFCAATGSPFRLNQAVERDLPWLGWETRILFRRILAEHGYCFRKINPAADLNFAL